MLRRLSILALLVAGSTATARVPPPVTISAICGNGAPTSYGAGAIAHQEDGSIFRNPWWRQGAAVKVSRDPALVDELAQVLDSINFGRVVFDKSSGPWCGVVRSIGNTSHAVRWPVRVDGNALRHDFAGMPEQVWYVYIRLVHAATTQKVCSETPLNQTFAGIALSCPNEAGGGEVGVRILAGGDVLLTESQPGKHCATVIGEDQRLFWRWQASLNQASFRTHRAGPGPTMRGSSCRLERTEPGGTGHQVTLTRNERAGSGWQHVQAVADELAALSWGHLTFDAGSSSVRTQQVRFLDRATRRPLARTEIVLTTDTGIRCIAAPCPLADGMWRTTSDSNGVVVVPAFLLSGSAYFQTDNHAAQAAHLGRRDSTGLLTLELN